VVIRLNTAIQELGIADVADFRLSRPEPGSLEFLGISWAHPRFRVIPECILAQSAFMGTDRRTHCTRAGDSWPSVP
jgi:hypothetical protein